MRVLIDVGGDRLDAEVVELLTRAGHQIVRGARAGDFDVALVATAEAAARIKRDHPHRVAVVVTQLGDVPERLRALAAGADDAVDRGFAPSQVMARIDAAGRRVALVPRPPERLELDGCTIDLGAALAHRDGALVALTAHEVELVRYLASHAGQVIERGALLHHVWRVSARNDTRAVDVAIAGLRAKLERDPRAPAIIVTVRGAGYRWGTDTLTNG